MPILQKAGYFETDNVLEDRGCFDRNARSLQEKDGGLAYTGEWGGELGNTEGRS